MAAFFFCASGAILNFMSFGVALSYSIFWLQTAAPYAAAGGIVIALIALLYAYSIHRRLRKLTTRRGEALEDSLSELMRRTKELQVFREELERYLKSAEARLSSSIRGVSVVRFNPFQGDGTGGNQSFSAALLDEGGSGVVFSAIYARGGATTYAKPVAKGSSPFELTGEEREAIAKARQALQIPSSKPQTSKV